MLNATNTESYVESAVKTRLRKRHITEVLRISRLHKRPANLKYLTLAGGHAIDANMLRNAAPDVFIHAVECIERQLHKMARNGPAGMSSEFDDMELFLDEFEALPSGIGDPACDGHFIGAYFDWFGGAERGNILPAMQFVADHRFVKPGFRTVISFTYKKGLLLRRQVDEAIARSLHRAEGEPHRFYSLDSAVEYTMLALSEACPALEITFRYKEEYKNRGDSTPMFFFIVEVHKPSWAPEFPSPGERVMKGSDGAYKIGGITLSGGPSMLTVISNTTATVATNRSINAAFDKLKRETRLSAGDLALFNYALTGQAIPRGNSSLGQTLYSWRSTPAKAAALALLGRMRSDWNTIARYKVAA